MSESDNTISIIVDNREREIIKIIKSLVKLNKLVNITQLPIGDLVIIVEGTPVFIIERKTLTDAAASIKDGRWREQKTRLKSWCVQNSQPHNHVLYIIEGDWAKYRENKPRLPPSTLKSAIVNTMIRDGFRILQTESTTDTIRVLIKMIKCLEKDGYYGCKSEPTTSSRYLSVNVIKKKNLTPEVCYIQQLACIPGLSVGLARTISSQYPTFSSLITAIKNDDKILLKIPKIGKTLNYRIIQYIQLNQNNLNTNHDTDE